MNKTEYVPTKPRAWKDRVRTRKLIAQPNKSMAVSEIVRRYSRGLDAGVSAGMSSDHPDSPVDLERLSRMDRLEKAFTADEMRRDNELIKAKADEELRRRQEEADEAKRQRIKAKKDADRKAPGPQGPGADVGKGSA